ncbi:uncharacterized protein LOC132048853 [Lycium ferocissimum]|uniref:uncharacterized protein LOC132048853 n=1 Tax=Lycium ferocissimum TaxID=112874 RepID=UPI0028157FFF|nr:uncharacterized protein LOC132048853 [Lycium ferocissimum]
MAWRAREKAIKDLRGDPADSYKKLLAYIYILDKTYPGLLVKMHKSPENEFMYLFVALKAFIKGFECCRPIVVVDGAHLKSTYNGTFVSASTLDGAGNILPVAYGVIDSENNKSWTWFFELFKQAYGVRQNMCVVSDRHESIIHAVSKVYPTVPHLACILHLWKNVTKQYTSNSEVLSPIFYSLAKAYTQDEFDKLMEKIGNLEDAGRDKWSRLYSPIKRGWTMTSNIAECINGKLVAARELHIFDFLEEVRKMFGRWNCTNRKNGTCTFTTLMRRYQEMLSINEYKSIRMRPETVVNTYDVPVDPLPDETEWNVPKSISDEVAMPPIYKRPHRRPKKEGISHYRS